MNFEEYKIKMGEIINNDLPTDFQMISLADNGKSTSMIAHASNKKIADMLICFFTEYPDILDVFLNEMGIAKNKKKNDKCRNQVRIW